VTGGSLREIPLLPLLRDELAARKAASSSTGPDDYVFPTAGGRARDKDNIRNRVLEPVAKRADELLAERNHPPLPKGLTPHKLRHTFASVLVACGEDPASVMAQLGHTDPKFTLRVYTHVMRRDPAERERLQALVDGRGVMGSFEGREVPEHARSPTRLQRGGEIARPAGLNSWETYCHGFNRTSTRLGAASCSFLRKAEALRRLRCQLVPLPRSRGVQRAVAGGPRRCHNARPRAASASELTRV
jgi:hypothetical protein